MEAPPTKRKVLSDIPRLFDPLGWAAPVTITANIFMQDLWILKCDLELCGAVLLVKLVRRIQELDFLGVIPIFLWCGSQVVLSWIRKHPCSNGSGLLRRVGLVRWKARKVFTQR